MSNYDNCTSVTPECPVEASIYGYYPSLAANVFFLAFFGTGFFLNLGLGLYYRTWTFMVFMCCACVVESIGYAGRIMMNENPWGETGFIMQIVCLIMGPAFNSGAIYLTLKYVTLTFGTEWSRIKPHLYTWIFITGDLISLILQAVGGAMASTAGNSLEQLDNGDDISMAGIIWQVFTLLVFGIVAADYIIRRARDTTPFSAQAATILRQPKFQIFAGGIVIAWLTILIRCAYRIAEFAQGWSGEIMRNETLFIVLDGVMIAIALTCQTVPHPGFCFPVLSSRSRTPLTDEPKGVESSDESKQGEQEVQ